MNWKRYGRKWSSSNSRYNPTIILERLKKAMGSLGEDRQNMGQDFNLGIP
jgi:hypothetical protein